MFVDFKFSTMKTQVSAYLNPICKIQFFSFLLIFSLLNLVKLNIFYWCEWRIIPYRNTVFQGTDVVGVRKFDYRQFVFFLHVLDPLVGLTCIKSQKTWLDFRQILSMRITKMYRKQWGELGHGSKVLHVP